MVQGDTDAAERTTEELGERDVEFWLGVYKSIDEVPSRYRLESFSSEFAGQDTWSDYLDTRDDLAESTKKNSWYPCGDRFKKFMQEEVRRHHALAHPDDIEAYLSHIKDGGYSIKVTERSLNTVYYQHLSPLKTFFAWLVHHVDYLPVAAVVSRLRDGRFHRAGRSDATGVRGESTTVPGANRSRAWRTR